MQGGRSPPARRSRIAVDEPPHHQRQEPGAGDRARRHHPARARRRKCGPEPRPDRPARESRALDRAAHRRRAGNRKAGDRRNAERARAARSHHPAACGFGAQRFHRAGAAAPRATVGGTARDRRPLDGQERSPCVHRPGDRLAAPAHRIGGRRNLPALLHRQRQSLSRAAFRRRRRGVDRSRLRDAHAKDHHPARRAAR